MILAIESAIRGGSLCIHDGVRTTAIVEGGGSVSRADELLARIDSALRSVDVAPREMDTVAVSIGPGSYTGIRIGVATALGLGSSVNARCVGISLLEALAFASRAEGEIISAIQLKKGEIAWQHFAPESKFDASAGGLFGGTYNAFARYLSANTSAWIVCDEFVNIEMSGMLSTGVGNRHQVYHASFAEAIANAAFGGMNKEPTPLYLNAFGGRF